MKIFLIFFAAQALNYFLLTIDIRATADGRLKTVLLCDAAIASLGFFLIQRIATAENSIEAWLGYTVGGLVGTTIAMQLDKKKPTQNCSSNPERPQDTIREDCPPRYPRP